MPTVAEAELLSFAKWTEDERREVESWLEENFTSINFDRTAARIASEIRRTVKVRFPDVAIAAIALSTNTPLVTRNVSDFRKITGLRILEL